MVNQLAMFSEIKKSLGNNRAVFKERPGAHGCYYTCDSVTVYPIVLILAEDSAVRRDSDIMSDDLKHDADAAYIFMGKLGAHVDIDELIVSSDGCGCQ